MAGKPNYKKHIRSWESEGFDVSELRREFEKSATKKKLRVASAIVLIILCVSPFVAHHLWKRNQLSRHLTEAERLLDQENYLNAWKKVEEASQYGFSEKSEELAEKLALLKTKLEDRHEAKRVKEEMEKIKTSLDLESVKKFDLEENYNSLLSDEEKGYKFFETDHFREAKSVFESTKERYAELSNKIGAAQKAEQDRLEQSEKERLESEKSERERAERTERLKLKALKAKEAMEVLKKLIDVPFAKRYVRNEWEASLSMESKALKAFESGRYEEAKGLFQSATVTVSELVEKIGAKKRSEEERAENEKLKHEAAKARSEMEVAKKRLDLKRVETFGSKQEYQTLLFEESRGKRNMEANQYSEAKEIFDNVRDAYIQLNDKIHHYQEIEIKKAENEKLRQKALKAKADMELVKRSLDMNMIQRYKAKNDHDALVKKEKEGKKCLENGKFEEARNIFEEINKGYTALDWRRLRTQYRLDIVPESVNFGPVRVLSWFIGGKARSKTILVANNGTQPVGIKRAIIETPTQGEFHFSFWENRGCLLPAVERHYLVLNPGESCKQDIDFTPRHFGVRSAHLTILLDDPDSTRIHVQMVGQGT